MLQARQVRQSAAENLGELTRMSMRVDQLATDLINNAKLADPAIQEAYLTALRGMLLSTGQRLSPAVLSKAGETLQSMMAGAGTQSSLMLMTIRNGRNSLDCSFWHQSNEKNPDMLMNVTAVCWRSFVYAVAHM